MMKYKDNPRFCILPFMVLNTRPNGQVKPCSQIMDMPAIKEDCTADNILDTHNRFLNLTEDSVEAIWNSKFLKDFRMKKINGEYIQFCETCYQEDKMGVKSKRQAVIDEWYDENFHLVEEAASNNGYMHTKPVWWEMRLSSICNQACRMCIPQTSSKMREEFTKFKNDLPQKVKDNTEFSIKQYKKHGYLGDSKFFLEQFWNNISDVKYLELHGGEPTNDKVLWDLVEKIVESGHSEHIHIHVHTNIHALKQKHVELWDKFKSGWIGVSIDAYAEENEYIRHGSDWSKIEENLKLLNYLGSHWYKWITSSVMVYNACTMHRLLDWFIDYTQTHQIKDLWWRMDPVINPSMMRLEHVPYHLRIKAIEKLTPLYDKANDPHTKESILSLKKALSSNQIPKQGSFDDLVSYTRILDIKRKQSVINTFPHLREIFKE